MAHDIDTIDRAAMALSGGLMLTGIVVLGIVEVIAGQPYAPVPMTNDAGEVIAQPMVDPQIRTGLVIAGLVVMLVYAGIKLVAGDAPTSERTSSESTA
jgi:hypothetical protein